MKPYELLLIITPDHDENEAEALTNQVKSIIEGGGTLLKVDPWGKKRLAYPIRKRSEGYYVLYIFESAPSFVAELNQSLYVIEAILRYMVVQYEDDIDKLKAELAGEAVEVEESTTDDNATAKDTIDDAETDENVEADDDAETDEDAEANDDVEIDDGAEDSDTEIEGTTVSA